MNTFITVVICSLLTIVDTFYIIQPPDSTAEAPPQNQTVINVHKNSTANASLSENIKSVNNSQTESAQVDKTDSKHGLLPILEGLLGLIKGNGTTRESFNNVDIDSLHPLSNLSRKNLAKPRVVDIPKSNATLKTLSEIDNKLVVTSSDINKVNSKLEVISDSTKKDSRRVATSDFSETEKKLVATSGVSETEKKSVATIGVNETEKKLVATSGVSEMDKELVATSKKISCGSSSDLCNGSKDCKNGYICTYVLIAASSLYFYFTVGLI